jgi:hypothetical protein
MTKYEGFRSLLYHKFIYLKLYRVDEVADRMGLAPDTFYKYMQGQYSFPVDLVGKLYRATGDIEFLNFILNDTDQMLTPRAGTPIQKDLVSETLDVNAIAGRIAEDVQKFKESGNSEIEKKKLNNHIDQGHKEIEDLRKVVNQD